ncbi:MAG: amylo-alpha-1,6-glucosidase [Tidjanibacter sp.]|nr:amylo-alpha-1,6-glucosidase [Tidjanibacter sp.]
MAELTFDKNSLGNLEYSLQREMLSTNRTGGYMSTTIVCCNTRKYHGLMVCPKDDNSEESYVLLSSLDETVIQHDQSFNLALHRFPGTYFPRGHKYIVDFDYNPTPTITYRVGGVLLKKEILWRQHTNHSRLLIRYTLLEAASPTTLRLRPFLAFRNKHALSHANMYANGHSWEVNGGVKCRLYDEFPYLFMQCSDPKTEFVAAPDWYYNFEYAEEYNRGYESHEDLLSTGYFEVELKKNKPLVFSASLDEIDPKMLHEAFDKELSTRNPKSDYLSMLRHSAHQFIVRRNNQSEVIAGYPWFGSWGRDTFISLPGITLAQGDVQACLDVLDSMMLKMQDGLFPNVGTAYNSVDAPLWFIWDLQQLEHHIGRTEVWNRYGEKVKEVLEAYRRGIPPVVALHDNGLIWASHPSYAMTWMDACVDGKPVTGRDGYQVEINSLWYNAVCYALEVAAERGDKKFVREWRHLPALTKESFLDKFWLDDGYLADYVNAREANVAIRPNQIIACSVDYKMLSIVQQESVEDVVKRHLLTPKGLRTLSPRNAEYKGRYEGDQATRDSAYHQGTVWVWPLEHYVKAKFDVQGAGYVDKAAEILAGFEEDMSTYGIGSIAEIYEGDPPHSPRGAISQAWSVGAVLRIDEMIRKYRKEASK